MRPSARHHIHRYLAFWCTIKNKWTTRIKKPRPAIFLFRAHGDIDAWELLDEDSQAPTLESRGLYEDEFLEGREESLGVIGQPR